MSGLLALLDDVAALTKLAAAQVDDIAAQAVKTGAKIGGAVLDDAAKAGAKATGIVIDDAAVTPKYVTGLPAARELPIVWQIARASFFNKLVVLLPAALLLSAFLPWLLTPLLMLGGAYLCFEGAEKVWHLFSPHADHGAKRPETIDAARLEKERVAGAIKTDFILSAEIMTLSLAAITSDSIVIQALVLAVVAIGITALVYGAVAILVKADDFGLRLSQSDAGQAVRTLGRGIVKAMPGVMRFISTIGTAAMLWVGGNIIVHGLHDLGWHWPYDTIHGVAKSLTASVPTAKGFAEWMAIAAMDGVIGLALGLVLIPIVTGLLVPAVQRLRGAPAGKLH
ncbi:MAG: DUF808 domain-containing protein [Pseudomonadota bacterium]